MIKPEDIIEELQKLTKYAEISQSPEEYFRHMQGHATELSLVLSTFSIVQMSKDIINSLEKQIPKKCFNEIDFGKTCCVCRSPHREGQYCANCGQKLEW